MRNVLVIAPHPDDEVLGCGGSILKHVQQGDAVFLCIMTKGDETYYGAELLEEKRKEVLAVSEFLGIKKVFFFDFIAASLDMVPLDEINHKLKNVFEECKPSIVYAPHEGDLHQDHQITFQSALVAAKPQINHYVKKIFSYEVISETEQSSTYNKIFIPTSYTEITKQLEKKLQALEFYTSELREYPHPRSVRGAENKARQRGNEVCLKAAEAFMLIRSLR